MHFFWVYFDWWSDWQINCVSQYYLFFGMAIIINGQSIFLHHKSNSEHCVKKKSVTLIFFDRNNNFKKPLFLKMLLLTDECSYNYHSFFFFLKSFKGLKFVHNPIRTHNYIFSLMNTKTASQVAFLRPL